jgi:hypothetical protein
MLIDCKRGRNPANEIPLVGMEWDLSHDLTAVRRGIGAELRTLYSDALREKIPDRIAELLGQLDQQKADDKSEGTFGP